MITKPTNIPTIPITPAKVGGAGRGSLRKENNTPTAKPVRVAIITSFITYYILSGAFTPKRLRTFFRAIPVA